MSFKLAIKPARLPKAGRYTASATRRTSAGQSRGSRTIARRRSMKSGGGPSITRLRRRGRLL